MNEYDKFYDMWKQLESDSTPIKRKIHVLESLETLVTENIEELKKEPMKTGKILSELALLSHIQKELTEYRSTV